MKAPILGSAYVARSVNAADNRMVNLFPEIVPEGGKEPAFLIRCPGLRTLETVGSGPVRGLWKLRQYGYAVSGNELYRIDSDWNSTLIGPISGSGPVSMADNGTQIFIAANPQGFIYNADTEILTQINDEDFPGAVTVGYLDGRFVFNEPDSQKVWVTALLDGTQIDPLEFASAEGAPDNLVAIIVDHREIWMMGVDSIEVWYNAGLADFPFQRIQGAYNEVGCAAPYSVAKMDNSIFWLGRDARGQGIVYRANGYTSVRISTHAIEYAIAQYSDISDAVAYTYQQEGHSFYVLNFPTGDQTWVYDASTQSWHERAWFSNGSFYRHRSNCQMSFNNEVVVGDFETGKIYAFDLDTYQDDGGIQKWLRSFQALPTGQNNLKRTIQHSLQLDMEVGEGICIPPIAEFSGDPLLGEAGTEVQLTDESENTPMSWSWVITDDLDDAVVFISNDQNPIFTIPVLTATTTFTVSLTVTNVCGTDTEIKAAYISASSDLEIMLSPGTSSVAGDFSDAELLSAEIVSTVSGGVPPYSLLWTKTSGDTYTLDNGSTAATQIFSSVRPEDGVTYSAVYRCTVTDSLANTAYAEVTITQEWQFTATYVTWNPATITGATVLSNSNKTAAFPNSAPESSTVYGTFGLLQNLGLVMALEMRYDTVNIGATLQAGIESTTTGINSATNVKHQFFSGYSKWDFGPNSTNPFAGSETNIAAPVSGDILGLVFNTTAIPPTLQGYMNGVAIGPTLTLSSFYASPSGQTLPCLVRFAGATTVFQATLRARPSEMTYFANYGADTGFVSIS
jgi:PKD repeat protein